MTVTELILYLEEFRALHGDMDVGLIRESGGGHGDPSYLTVSGVIGLSIVDPTRVSGDRHERRVHASQRWAVFQPRSSFG